MHVHHPSIGSLLNVPMISVRIPQILECKGTTHGDRLVSVISTVDQVNSVRCAGGEQELLTACSGAEESLHGIQARLCGAQVVQ
jgi:hypothetical protein